ncbi:MAG: isocitrate lyase/phosphoenolpyruvate mutase family protein [Mucilaginibacter sp.]|uniref:isocitrate lyase/PEP mutase family protein n=1 Tax=Mucilaginibacter sp. TaxID=1882438 RepID=UPI0031B3F2A1
MSLTQKEKAELFLQQHTADKLLILPNVWDTLSAKLVSTVGFPSLATASIGMALANGYPDGEHIPFKHLTSVVSGITASVDLPVSVDLERGFSENLSELKDNVKKLLDAGAVGLNIEDGVDHGKEITPIAEQCLKIEAIREAGIQYGVPVVINARTDLFFQPQQNDTIDKVIERAKAYRSAGADCFFPILISNYLHIARLVEEADIPVSVILFGMIRDLRKLENLGVARVSVGPALIIQAITKMKNIAEGLLDYNSDELFAQQGVPFEYLSNLI